MGEIAEDSITVPSHKHTGLAISRGLVIALLCLDHDITNLYLPADTCDLLRRSLPAYTGRRPPSG